MKCPVTGMCVFTLHFMVRTYNTQRTIFPILMWFSDHLGTFGAINMILRLGYMIG